MGYSSMSHTSWWSAQNNKQWIHALITNHSEWSHKIDRIISSMHKCSLWSNTWSSMSHKHSISTKSKQRLKNHQIKQERTKATHSLSRSLWSIRFSPPLATSYQKVHRKCIVLDRLSGLIFRWWCPYNSKDEGFSWSRGCWSWCWSWLHWSCRSCTWCRWCGSGVCHRHCNWPLGSRHSGKYISGSLGLPLLHVIL